MYRVTDEKCHDLPVGIRGKSVAATLDLNSDTSFMRVDLLHEICEGMDDEGKEVVYENVVKGRLTMDVEINGEVLPVEFKIVRASRIQEMVQFGRDVVGIVDVLFKDGEARVLAKDSRVELRKDNGVAKSLVRYLCLVLSMIAHGYESTRFKTREIVAYALTKLESRQKLDDLEDPATFSDPEDEKEFQERWGMLQDFHKLQHPDTQDDEEDEEDEARNRNLLAFVLKMSVLPTVGYAVYEIYSRDLFFQNLFLF